MRRVGIATAAALCLAVVAAAALILVVVIVDLNQAQAGCSPAAPVGLSGGVAGTPQRGSAQMLPPGPGRLTAATMYGGPGDSSSGSTGASGKNLTGTLSFAELGTSSFAPSFNDADNIGNELFGLGKPLAFGTKVKATFDNGKAIVVEKQDIGQGGAPGGGAIGKYQKSIDFWYEVIQKIYGTRTANSGLWSGIVKLQPVGSGATSAAAGGQDCAAGAAAGSPSTVAGTKNFQRSPCAIWIANYLEQAQSDGVQFQITPGNCYRSTADQARVCATGVKPCAPPGTSRHQGLKYPNGAVDINTGVAQLEAYFRKKGIPLYNAGGKDPPHFSTSDKEGLPGY